MNVAYTQSRTRVVARVGRSIFTNFNKWIWLKYGECHSGSIWNMKKFWVTPRAIFKYNRFLLSGGWNPPYWTKKALPQSQSSVEIIPLVPGNLQWLYPRAKIQNPVTWLFGAITVRTKQGPKKKDLCIILQQFCVLSFLNHKYYWIIFLITLDWQRHRNCILLLGADECRTHFMDMISSCRPSSIWIYCM